MQSNDPSRATPPSGSGSISRVLVVDDSRLQRRILAGSLKKWGFEVIEADSGDAALHICRAAAPDLVLSDWMMPGMDGIEFCREFRQMDRADYGYFILLTSKSDKMEIAQGLDAGADDFLTKPVNPGELRARISAGDRIIAMQRELSDKNQMIGHTLQRLQAAYDAIDRDLVQAKKIQQSMVPELSRDFGASKVSLLLKPCGHIGGDLVGMFSARPGQVGFYSIDVSGHGITSAMMTARLGGYLSPVYFDQNLALVAGNDGHDLRAPTDLAKLLNERQLADTGIDEYFTMIYATVDLATGMVQMVQAGHPYPMIIRPDGGVEFVGQGGLPIGLMAGAEFTQSEFRMHPGERLLLYSDGFTECSLAAGGMLEAEGLADLVRCCQPGQSGQEFLDDLYWNLTEIMAPGQGMEDDISATLFEFNGL